MASNFKEKVKTTLAKGALVMCFGLVTGMGLMAWSLAEGQKAEQAKKAVENYGFSNVKIAYSFNATENKCGGKSGDEGWDFQAKNVKGGDVSGYVCKGDKKGFTVAF